MCWSYEDAVNNLHCVKSGFAGNSPSFLRLAISARNKEQLRLFRFPPFARSPPPAMVRQSLKPPLRFTSAPFPPPTRAETWRMRAANSQRERIGGWGRTLYMQSSINNYIENNIGNKCNGFFMLGRYRVCTRHVLGIKSYNKCIILYY